MLLLQDTLTSASFLGDFELDHVRYGGRRTLAPDELRFLVQRVETLELQPLHECSEGERTDLLRWTIETSDFCFTPNPGLLSRLLSTDRNHSRLLAAQVVLSSAAFKIAAFLDHDARGDSQKIVDRAALLGVLRCYSRLRRLDVETQFGFLDELVLRSQEAWARTGGHAVQSVAA